MAEVNSNVIDNTDDNDGKTCNAVLHKRGAPPSPSSRTGARNHKKRREGSFPASMAAAIKGTFSSGIPNVDNPEIVMDKERGTYHHDDDDDRAGLRRVKPYIFVFQMFAKSRWFGKTLIDLFKSEFKACSEEYYREAIATGRITVRDKPSSPDYIVKNGDYFHHMVHRHEPPVSDEPVRIVGQTDKLLAVYKPSSLPIHPTGRYRHQTLAFILVRDHGLSQLRAVHRLDRLTSGIVIFGKTSEAAAETSVQFREHTIIKKYVARVSGQFPKGCTSVDQPIDVVDKSRGVCRVDAVVGKESKTEFTLLRYDSEGDESIVECRPYTGRTHQIRVHLKYLGFPIVNDPLYGPRAKPLSAVGGDQTAVGADGDDDDAVLPPDAPLHIEYDHSNFVPWCNDCSRMFHSDEYYADPTPAQRSMWLHAFYYSGKDWKFEINHPDWANIGKIIE